jgi:hypothetical protein
MYDFARLIAAGEICPSFAFSFKPLDPTVLVHHPTTPKCVIRPIGRVIYSVSLILTLVSHDAAAYSVKCGPPGQGIPKDQNGPLAISN